MKITLFEILKNAVKDSMQTQRKNWLLKWPSQLIIASDQILWTSSVTQAIHDLPNNNKALQQCYTKHQQELLQIVVNPLNIIKNITYYVNFLS